MTPTTATPKARCCIKQQGHINNIDEDINMQTPTTITDATTDQLPLHDYSATASSPSAASDSSTLIDSLDTGLVSTSASDSASSSHATGISKTIATTTMVPDIRDGMVKCVQGLLDGERDDNDGAVTTIATGSITSTVRKVSFNEVVTVGYTHTPSTYDRSSLATDPLSPSDIAAVIALRLDLRRASEAMERRRDEREKAGINEEAVNIDDLLHAGDTIGASNRSTEPKNGADIAPPAAMTTVSDKLIPSVHWVPDTFHQVGHEHIQPPPQGVLWNPQQHLVTTQTLMQQHFQMQQYHGMAWEGSMITRRCSNSNSFKTSRRFLPVNMLLGMRGCLVRRM